MYIKSITQHENGQSIRSAVREGHVSDVINQFLNELMEEGKDIDLGLTVKVV